MIERNVRIRRRCDTSNAYRSQLANPVERLFGESVAAVILLLERLRKRCSTIWTIAMKNRNPLFGRAMPI
jgi:hypothetical protein